MFSAVTPVDDFYWLNQIQSSDRPLVGDKAFYLSYLLQRGYPTIPGFVISARAFCQFLETIDWLEPFFADLPNSSLHLDVGNPRQLQAIARQIRQTIQTTELPGAWLTTIAAATKTLHAPVVILRPSLAFQPAQSRPPEQATKPGSVEGLLEAQICQTQPDAIAQGLKRLWADLFRARNLFYWQQRGIQLQHINLAVLIQPLYPAIASGALQVEDSILEVQSTWGLGMSLVRGEVLPDLHQIQRASGIVQTQQLGSKTLAYRVVDRSAETRNPEIRQTRPDPSGSQTLPLLEPPEAASVQSYWVDEQQQQQYALTKDQLWHLSQLTQSLMADFGHPLSIEWVLAADDDAPAEFYLTQLSIRSPSRKPKVAVRPTVSSKAEDQTNERPIATGLAASGGQTIAQVQILRQAERYAAETLSGKILVVPTVTPDWLPLLKQAAGIIAEQGGMTSHGAIVARELGIPAVVGVANATYLLQPGDLILLNGDRGTIHRLNPNEGKALAIRQAEQAAAIRRFLTPRPGQTGDSAAGSLPTIATQLMVNLSQPELIEQVAAYPIDGVGLLRSELMLLTVLDQEHPQRWLQQGRQSELIERIAERIIQFAQAFSPRPVFYRSLDLRAHEFAALAGSPPPLPGGNSMLGIRGTLSYQQHPELFDVELMALTRVQAAGYHNVHLMLPFVRTVEEFQSCHQRIQQAGLHHSPHFQVWIMAEVPSVLLLLPDYIQAGVQGISIGTNDLTQLILGIDRDYPELAAIFDERHPAVMRAITLLVETARSHNIPCSICGQAPAQYPELIEHLVKLGITSISVEPAAVESTYQAIARIEQRLLLDAIRHQSPNERS